MRTFHYAGVAEHVPTGLPRLIEIVDAKKAPKKPIIDIHLKKEFSTMDKAKKVASELEEVLIEDVATVEENFEKRAIRIVLNEAGKEKGIGIEEIKKIIKKKARIKSKILNGKLFIKPKVNKGPPTYRSIRRLSELVKKILIRGVSGIRRAVVIEENGELFIRARGSNIQGVIHLQHPAVDLTKIYTNDIKMIYDLFGIEAARAAIVKEAKEVMDSQGLDVDIRHILLLADAMCVDGIVKSVGRHGLSGQKAGVLARAAFEETVKHLARAAVQGEVDHLKGITENVIVGQIIPTGTGVVKLCLKTVRKKKRKKGRNKSGC
jgi:DNA-directed RNA polymerase subunit A"